MFKIIISAKVPWLGVFEHLKSEIMQMLKIRVTALARGI